MKIKSNSKTLYHLYFLLAILLAFSSAVHCQKKTPENRNLNYQKGEQFLLEGHYSKAVQYFTKSIQEDSTLCVTYRALGVSYSLSNRNLLASEAYIKAIDCNPNLSRVLYYEVANTFFTIGKHQEALDYYLRFQTILDLPRSNYGYLGQKERRIEKKYILELDRRIADCKLALEQDAHIELEKIKNLGANINTTGDEYFPFLINSQQTLLYTSSKNVTADENILYASLENGDWAKGKGIDGNINTEGNEGMCTLTSDGVIMLFTACGRQNIQGPCDIHEVLKDTSQVNQVRPIKGKVNSKYWESQASISCDGSILYFASNRQDGYGGTDIWYANRTSNGSWSEPINAGENINTSMDEEAPFITNDGKTLFFSSTGHTGMGEQDIFYSLLETNKSWGKAINLGAPINSAYRELGFFMTAEGKTGYFSSDRPAGYGGMDIYQFDLIDSIYSEPITFVEGFVTESQTRLPIKTLIRSKEKPLTNTDVSGRFFLCLPSGKNTPMQITLPGYEPFSADIEIPKWSNKTPYKIEIELHAKTKQKNIKQNEILREEIFFTFDKHTLKGKHKATLDQLVLNLENKNISSIDIHGYTDQSGSNSYNNLLSQKRANSVGEYLRQQGLQVNKIKVIGFGETDATGDDLKERKVEVIIMLH